ncbi:FAD-dependent oxidoreductase [Glycomyces luteolus]|uniref:FAD-dependent oxidoreductase n=1 Tax=Glycomyces luteolus TaxID=2670330 RepID=A0A9X3PCG1_9ACTN|nr:FAD-dependent oxidoreductase [Glycomyces luteolus]MDA1361561.1 FAD-dependent oxidoreductase [Glycomyces luteolus]
MRIAIVGAGSIGLAVAWRAAQSGAEVVVHDPDPGSGASRVAAGMIAPVTESHYGEAALGPFMAASADAWPGLARDLEAASGLAIGFRDVPTLVVGVEDGDRAEIDRQAELYRLTARNVETLTARAARKVEPLLSHRVRGGVLAPEDRAVDPRVVHDALLIAAERAGVELRAERIDDLAELDADQVVIAAGCGSASFVGAGGAGGANDGAASDPGSGPDFPERHRDYAGTATDEGCLAARSEHSDAATADGRLRGRDEAASEGARWTLPVRPVRGAVLRLRTVGDQPLPRTTVRGYVKGHPIYIVTRESGEIVVGASSDERGFDRRTGTAGVVHDLLRRAIELVPEIAEYHLDEVSVGFRPGTPDNLPLIGRLDSRTVAATGHYRNGIALIPATATGVAALLAGDDKAIPAAFDPLRFGPFARQRPNDVTRRQRPENPLSDGSSRLVQPGAPCADPIPGSGQRSAAPSASAPESRVPAGSDKTESRGDENGHEAADDTSTHEEADS